MATQLGRYGVWRFLRAIDPDMAREVESLGYGAIWIGGSPPGDLAAIEEVIAATEGIPIVTGIVNMWREDAEAVGESYLRIEDRHPERLVLGVGVGHPETTEEYRSPLDKINDYLDRLEEVGVPSDRLVLAALGPKALEIAARRTIGAHPYLTTPRHTRLARSVIGEDALLAPEQKVVLGSEPDRARDSGRNTVARYLRLVNYRSNLLREGWDERDLVDGGSDELIDELVLHPDAGTVSAGIRSHIAAGADHVCIQVLGSEPMAGYRELSRILPG